MEIHVVRILIIKKLINITQEPIIGNHNKKRFVGQML